MSDPNSPQPERALVPPGRPAPEKVQAYVVRHGPFFLLLAVLLAQFLLVSYQMTRNHNFRLIQVWTVEGLRPFQDSAEGLADTAGRGWKTVRDLWTAEQENQRLHAQLVEAHARIQALSEQAAEADRLRRLLEFRRRLPFPTVAGEVIASSPGQNSNAVFIDKGSDDGLESDLAVITPEGIVGKTIAVFSHTSQVLLITDPASGVGSLLEGSRAQGVLKGDSQNLCRLDYVMNEEEVRPGEGVVTSGLDQIYPKGLPVGTVAGTSEGNIYKRIAVRPAASLDRLEAVLVVLKPAPADEQQASRLAGH